MAKKNYDEASALKSVSKKCNVDYSTKLIRVNNESGQVGNGTWGKIDYLCHYCGWIWMRDLKAAGKVVHSDNTSKPKTNKREAKEVDKKKSNKKMMK